MKNTSALSLIALILICAGIQTGKAQSTLQLCIYDVDGGSGDTTCSTFTNDACIDGADYGDLSEKFSDPFTLPCVNSVDSIQFDLYYFDCDSFDVVTFSFYLNGSLIGTYQDLSGECSCTPSVYPLSFAFSGALIDAAFNPSGQNVISVQHDGFNMAVAGYTATVYYPGLTTDVGVTAMISPVSACGLTATENVTITVQNFGTASQNQVDVAYSINGGPAVTETINPPLAPGNSTSYTFSTTADLSVPGTYSFKAWTFLTGEMCAENDTLSGYTVINGAPPVAYPYIENFESQANCSQNCGIACNLTGTFQNVTTDGTDWAVDAGGTPTNNTGPSVDHTLGTAAGKYIYVEASGACNPSITAVLESGCFDISSMTNPLLSFWFHMAGAAMGRLNTEIYSGGSWIPVDSIIGSQQLSETDPWLEKNIDLSPFSGIIKVRFTGITGTGTTSDMAIDDIKIYEILSDDIGVLSVNSPQSGCLSANESITVTVVNNGLNTAVNIPVSYSIDTGAVVYDTISALMNPGDTIQFTFSSAANFSLPGNYSVSVWASMTGDGNPSNDSIGGYTVQSLTPYNTYPYLEDFETQILCAENCGTPCSITGNFSNSGSDNTDWTADEGGTPTFNTGPTVDHTLGSATGNYLYIEASNPCFPNQTAILQSSCFDLSSLTMPVLSFWYHMAGAGMGKLYTDVFSGGVWNRVDSLVGPQQAAETDPWLKRNIYLSAFTGTVQIRIAGVTGTASSSDMAIDDIEISDAPSDDAAVLAIIAPATGCQLTSAEQVAIQVFNAGSSVQSAIPVSYSVNGGPAVNDTLLTALSPGDTAAFSFALTADLSIPGSYSINAWTSLASDNDNSNDSIIGYIAQNLNVVSSFPFSEDFESQTTCVTTCMTACTITGSFTNAASDNTDWTVNEGNTPSNTTGPTVDHTTGLATGNYIYLEATTPCFPNIAAVLESECFDIGSLSSPSLSFWYHMAGAAMGKLYTDVYSGSGWYRIDSLVGTQQAVEADPWLKRTLSLSSFAGIIRIRFTGVTANDYSSDMAIDDIKISDMADGEIEALSINAPQSGCLSFMEPITITIVNNGTDTASNFPVFYSVDSSTVIADSITAAIAPGDTLQFTFSATADFSTAGTYSISAWTALTGDGDPTNDSITGYLVQSWPVMNSYPFIEDFETQSPCTENCGTPCTITGNFFNASSDYTDWTTDEGGTPTFNTGPSVDHTLGSATGNYIYIEASNPCFPDQTAILQSICFDLSPLSSPVLGFWYHMAGTGMGNLYTDIFSGGVWNRIDSLTGPQQAAETSPWLQRTVSLASFTGTIQIRFVGVTGTASSSDMAIDDIEIYEGPSVDVAMVSMDAPVSGCALGSNENITVTIQNLSATAQTNITVTYTVNGGSPVNETITDTILAGGTLQYTFSTTADFSAYTMYLLSAWVSLGADSNNTNDSITGYSVSNNPVCCIPTYGSACTSDDYIDGVDFAGIYNSGTGCNNNPDNYIYDSTSTASVTTGNSYSITITPSVLWDQGIGVWIDFNQNGLFSDSGEFVFSSPPSTTPVSGTIVIPVSALPGKTIMRIRCVYNYEPVSTDDCNNQQFGETEDYPVVISAPFTDVSVNSFLSPVTGCGLSANEMVEILVENTGSTPVTGIVISWSVNGGPAVTETITDTIPPLSIYSYIFAATADLSAIGTYSFAAWISTPGDTIFTNDTISGYIISNVTGITVDLGSDTAVCGSYILEAGNPGASFLWSTGETTQQITVSSSGSYWVEVNAAGCPPAFDTVIIVISAPVIVNLGPDTAACTDTIMLDAGNPGATYSWSTGVTTKTIYVTASGTYWVDVTGGGGCKVRDSINIFIAPSPVVDLGIDAAYCASHVLDAGNPGASYIWSNGATGQSTTVTSSGVYSVTVTSGPSCSATDQIVLVIYPGPMVDLGSDTSICSAGSITLDAGSGADLTYQWSTGASTQMITVTTSGTYSVVVTNTTNGCTDRDTIIVGISPNPPSASFTYSDSGLTVTFTNTSANSISWWWTFGDVVGISDMQNPVYTYSSPGTYVVTLTATNACGTNVFSDTISVDIIGIYDPEFNVKFSVIPNPADAEFTVVYSGSNRLVSISIAGMDGREITKIIAGNSFRIQKHFDASLLPAGVYLLRLETETRNYMTKIFIN